MLRTTLIAVSILTVAIAAPQLANAKSIKNLVSHASLAQFCADAGVDTETTATVTLPDGTTVTGTIHCEAADVPGGDDQPGDDNGGANGGDDDGPGHDQGDDNGGNSGHLQGGGDGVHSGSGKGGEDSSGPGQDNQGNDDGPNHDAGDDNGGGDNGGGHHQGGEGGDN